jgi:alcohol dehydrogenase
MGVWTYQHKTKIVFGPGALGQLAEELKQFGGGRALVVSGRTAMRAAGVLDRISELLGGNNCAFFDRIPPNPPLGIIEECAEAAKSEKCGVVVAVGGGSPLDAAKAAALLATNGGPARPFFAREKTFVKPGLPLIAVPTTAGTGSEVGPFMVATDIENETKLACGPALAFPAVAIMDPELTVSLPKDQTASTGLDALSHCFEAYWSKRSQPASDANALDAMRVVFDWLPRAFADGSDIEARTKMMYSSMTAGFAFGNTGTAAAHAISYPLTVKWGIDHGFACAFILSDIMAHNWDSLGADRQQRLLEAAGASSRDDAVSKLRAFCEKMGTPPSLAAMGIETDDIPFIVSHANPFNMMNNVSRIDDAQTAAILRKRA